MKKFLFIILLLSAIVGKAQKESTSPLPNRYQLAWHDMEYYLFVHFGPNTFDGKEWGSGKESPDVFDPTQFDPRQWCRIARAAGAKGIIITAKHHDGFCLWPSKHSSYTVKESKWRHGYGDVLRELSYACREYGLKFGVYLSPWDKNHPDYGTDEYNDVFKDMLKEVLKNYGPVWELWLDGANGEGPNGKMQKYDWEKFIKTVRKVSPATVIFSDIGPDIRWVGNEKGIAGDPNWNFLNTTGFSIGAEAPPPDTLLHGNYYGQEWIPAECDISIRPSWFWKADEDDKIKSADELFKIYLRTVGRGANLLLNVPPDNRGMITAKDSAALMEFKKIRRENFAVNLLKKADSYYEFSQKDFKKAPLKIRDFDSTYAYYGINLQNFIVHFQKPTTLNCIALREAIHLGQTIRKFRIVLYNGPKVVSEINGTSIGHKRILTFPAVTVTSFRVYLEDAKGNDNISGIAAYLIDEKFINP